jgi:hypothetical protein
MASGTVKKISGPAYIANDKYFSPGLRLSSTDFLTGVASAANSLVITVMGSQHVV